MLDVEVIGIEAASDAAPTAVELKELCALALSSAGISEGHVAIEFVDLALEIAPLGVELFGRQRRLLSLQCIPLLPQRLFLMRNILGVFSPLSLNLLAHHLGGLRVLQERLNVDNDHR